MNLAVYVLLALAVIVGAFTCAALVMIVIAGLRTRGGDRCTCGRIDFRHEPCAVAWVRNETWHQRPPQACQPVREAIL